MPVKIRIGDTRPPVRVAAHESSPGLEAETQPRIRVPEPSNQFGNVPQAEQWASPAATDRLLERIPQNAIEYLRDTFSPAHPPTSDRTVRIPLSGSIPPDAIRVDNQKNTVSMAVRDVPLNEVLGILALHRGLNIIAAEDVTARVSSTLNDVPFEQALTNILSAAGYTYTRQDDILIVTSTLGDSRLPPHVQGREVRIFSLDYVTAADVDLVIKGFLSPVGQSFITSSAKADDRRTQELLVVEDLPTCLARIEQTVRGMDQPPRQVLIEAYVLSIELDDDVRHGLNLEYLDQVGTPSVTLRTQGLADVAKFAAGTSPALFFNLAESDLRALLEALETTRDAKTLAQPKVLALNGQEARIQIGEKLAYHVTTSTETSTLESVDFLDVGVVLTVTPRITRDNDVVMTVKPEVSSGEINTTTELPDQATTEVQTALMLPDGHGMVIGGLIQEEDIERQQKIPIIGDLWLIGRLFQRRELERSRREIVIALIPHIVPYQPLRHQRECQQFYRAATPLLRGPLMQNPRPAEPRLPDAGQRLPLRCKTRHLCPIPDESTWVAPGPLEPCVHGAEHIPPAHGHAIPFEQGTATPGSMLEHGEVIPPPLSQPLH
jgi:type II secretory pathway component GspD/PulD (secretin)